MYKRNLSYTDIYLLGLGHIIGAGIYSLIARVNSDEVSGYYGPLAVLLCGLGVRYIGKKYYKIIKDNPESNGSEYIIVKQKLGKKTANLNTLAMIVGSILSMVVISGTFGEYLNYLVPALSPTTGALICSLVSTGSSLIGTKNQLFINNLVTGTEATGLLAIIGSGLVYFTKNREQVISNISQGLKNSKFSLSGLMYGIGIIIFAYFGFESIPKIAEEAKNKDDVPKALVNSIDTSVILYVLVSVSLLLRFNPSQMNDMKSPLAKFIDNTTGGGKLFSVVPMLSTFNTFLIILLATSRLSKFLIDKTNKKNKNKNLSSLTQLNKSSKTPFKLEILISLITMSFIVTGYNEIKTVLISNFMIIVSILVVFGSSFIGK